MQIWRESSSKIFQNKKKIFKFECKFFIGKKEGSNEREREKSESNNRFIDSAALAYLPLHQYFPIFFLYENFNRQFDLLGKLAFRLNFSENLNN